MSGERKFVVAPGPHVRGGASTADIKSVAVEQGMRTMRQDGWDKVMQGMTSIEEVLRVVI